MSQSHPQYSNYRSHDLPQPPVNRYQPQYQSQQSSSHSQIPQPHESRGQHVEYPNMYQPRAPSRQSSLPSPTSPQPQRYPSTQAQIPQATTFQGRPPTSPLPSRYSTSPSSQLIPQQRSQIASGRISPQNPPTSSFPQRHALPSSSSSSPATTSPPRRPLPTPQLSPRPESRALHERRPLPPISFTAGPSSSTPPSSFHRPTMSVSNVPPSSSEFSASSGFSSRSNEISSSSRTGATSPTNSRPLPSPIPRSTKSLDLTHEQRENVLGPHELLPKPGQKFVPHWKRALPSPGPRPGSQMSMGSGNNMLSNVSLARTEPVPSNSLERGSTTSRPLPASPGMSKTSQDDRPFGRDLPSSQLPPTRPTFGRPASAYGHAEVGSSPTSTTFQSRERSQTMSETSPVRPSSLPYLSGSNISSPPRVSTFNSGYIPSTTSLDSPSSSDSEDMYQNSLLTHPSRPASQTIRPASPTYGIRDLPQRDSPSYGIRDLPTRSGITSQPTGAVKQQSGRVLPVTSTIIPNSVNARLASLSLSDSGNPAPPLPQRNASPPKREHSMPIMERASTDPGRGRWPTNLPPLPKAPQTQPSNSSPTRSMFAPSTQPTLPSPTRSSFTSGPQRERPAPPQHPSRGSSPIRPQPIFPSSSSSRNTSPVRQIPPQHPSRQSSPIRSQFPSSPFHSRNPSTGVPAPPQSPTRNQTSNVSPSQGYRGRGLPDLDDAPPPSLRRSPSPVHSSQFSHTNTMNGLPSIRTRDVEFDTVRSPSSIVTPSSATSAVSISDFPQPPYARPAQAIPSSANNGHWAQDRQSIPKISFPASPDSDSDDEHARRGAVVPTIATVSSLGNSGGAGLPQISIAGIDDDGPQIPVISVGGPEENVPRISVGAGESTRSPARKPRPRADKGKEGLVCGGCGGAILGRIMTLGNSRWHSGCVRCCICDELLQDMGIYMHEGRPYCHLDYHETFSPRCYHCQTPIVDEIFVTLDDPELGKRTYHEQHFFCAECGDPFLTPSTQKRTFSGDGSFPAGDGVDPFTVYHGHPYCEACHIRLRLPKCKRCKKSIRDGMVEALGAKWCWECFVCTSCSNPFDNPKFFLRDDSPYCEGCFTIMIRNEL